MNNSLISSMVTMNALQQKLDIMSNNLANESTIGFKRKQATFEDVLTNVKQQPKGFQKEGRLSPLGYTQGWGAKLSQVQLDLSQGTLQATGNPGDLAIEGTGMFEVSISRDDVDGNPVNTPAYTRDGTLNLAINPNDPNNLYLTTKDGHFIRGTNDETIRIPRGYSMSVNSTGVVLAYNKDSPQLGSLPVGQIKLVKVVRPQYLEQIGENLYSLPPEVNNAQGQVLQAGNNGTNLESKITIRQGFLEQSNVSLGDEMTELLVVQRAYQLSAKAVSSADTMTNLANNLRG